MCIRIRSRSSSARRMRSDSATPQSGRSFALRTTPTGRRTRPASNREGKIMVRLALGLLWAFASTAAWCQLDKISNQDAGSGLRAALEKGTQAGGAKLRQTDGLLAHDGAEL